MSIYIKLAIAAVIAFAEWQFMYHWFPCNGEKRIALFIGTCILLASFVIGG